MPQSSQSSQSSQRASSQRASEPDELPIDVTVIVVAHNVCDYALACLRSIDEQRGQLSVETILVDSASTDGLAQAVARAHPDVTVIRLARNEAGPGRNHGLRVARGRHRMFLDSDARLTPGALDDLVTFLDAHPDVGLVGPRLSATLDGESQHAARRFPSRLLPLLRRPPLGRYFEHRATVNHHLMRDVPEDRTREAEYVIGACMLFTAAAQASAGELDPAIPIYEDTDWCLRIRLGGYRIAYRPEVTVIHAYQRLSSRRPLSRHALVHVVSFARLQWKWRRRRRELVAEGKAMEGRGWAL
jgi:N-acetylglucosaminyl-diphospho-decaprenol L-rhamnosyltransferase